MLSRTQLALVGILLLTPLLLFSGVGLWTLWESGRGFWLSWSIPVCWGIVWLLLRVWRKPLIASLPDLDQSHWTPRDEAAAELIRLEQEQAKSTPLENLTDLSFYRQTAEELAGKIARHYHPQAADPLSNLTVLEVLAATQLVSEDLEDWLQRFIPGSHLITISQWRMLSKAPQWWQMASNVGWIASIVMNPVNIGRYFASKLAVDPLSKQLQGGLLTTFYLLYIRQVGFYLIEMNSGRLRGGANNYRRMMKRLHPDQQMLIAAETADVREKPAMDVASVDVSIAVIGQVKAGKSSLINCLLGGQQAVVDVLPSTRSVERYRLESLGSHQQSESLTLLDTPGYGEAGATPAQWSETLAAVRQADLVLLVSDAKSPAKQADAKVLQELKQWFAGHSEIKPPPIVGVLNKIDLLSPVMEWQPPYDWTRPTRPKEESIAGAVGYLQEQLGKDLDAVVPVCADRERQHVFGIEDALLPVMSELLPEARAVSLTKTLHTENDRGKYRRVFQQILEAGLQLKAAWGKSSPH